MSIDAHPTGPRRRLLDMAAAERESTGEWSESTANERCREYGELVETLLANHNENPVDEQQQLC